MKRKFITATGLIAMLLAGCGSSDPSAYKVDNKNHRFTIKRDEVPDLLDSLDSGWFVIADKMPSEESVEIWSRYYPNDEKLDSTAGNVMFTIDYTDDGYVESFSSYAFDLHNPDQDVEEIALDLIERVASHCEGLDPDRIKENFQKSDKEFMVVQSDGCSFSYDDLFLPTRIQFYPESVTSPHD